MCFRYIFCLRCLLSNSLFAVAGKLVCHILCFNSRRDSGKSFHFSGREKLTYCISLFFVTLNKKVLVFFFFFWGGGPHLVLDSEKLESF